MYDEITYLRRQVDHCRALALKAADIDMRRAFISMADGIETRVRMIELQRARAASAGD